MLTKLAIGTANFTQKYGIFSNGHAISQKEVNSIFNLAVNFGIDTCDTAFAYGDLFSVIKNNPITYDIKIINKFSVLDNYQSILNRMQFIKDRYNFKGYYAILLHNPQELHNLNKTDQKKLSVFFDTILENSYAKKIGVSCYDLEEVKQFNSIKIPDIIQVPLNPLNQKFINNDFFNYINNHNIEIHARSLFLQGLLLTDNLPEALIDLKPLLDKFIKIISPYRSRLKTILSWASSQNWVHKWVLGVNSLDNLQEIINYSSDIETSDFSNLFIDFKNIQSNLIDPRNWLLT